MSNRAVLERARSKPLSTKLLRQQLLYLGKIARRGPEDRVRKSTFQLGTFSPLDVGARRQGRPRHTWTDAVMKTAHEIAGTTKQFEALMASTAQADKAWRAAVQQYYVSI